MGDFVGNEPTNEYGGYDDYNDDDNDDMDGDNDENMV
jgi:hypothetical protein